MDKKSLGRYGENLAAAYLQRRGYRIIGRNYQLQHLELDLVAQKNGQTIIFEIKTRLLKENALQDSLVSRRQKLNLKKAAKKYAAKLKINFDLIHFDLILINLDCPQKKAHLKHFSDIF